jgi:hypothetical protein
MYKIIRGDVRAGVLFACDDCGHKIYANDFPKDSPPGNPRTQAASAMWEHIGKIHGAFALVTGARPLGF